MVHLLLVIIYLAFISLGLPDSLLGSAWPSMYPQLGVPVSYAGAVTMIIAAGTVVSSLMSDRLTHKLGAGKVTAFSVALTSAALFGFSTCTAFWQLCVWAVPYGLGAGSVDAALNNYVALHFESRHMSWLHCMWGVGATAGPYIMGAVLTNGGTWNGGYRTISAMQIVLTAILFASLPLWKRNNRAAGEPEEAGKLLSLREAVRVSGVKEIMICFFCYSAVEQTTGLWASSYLTLCKGMNAETAASFGAMFFLGVTIGRGLNGFVAMKLNDLQMIRLGEAIVGCGLIILFLPLGAAASLVGFAVIGLGCAPIYPCIIHSTPDHFGADKSQAIIGIQMASAYIGTCLMPPLFGLIASALSAKLLPVYLLVFLILMVIMHERLVKATKH